MIGSVTTQIDWHNIEKTHGTCVASNCNFRCNELARNVFEINGVGYAGAVYAPTNPCDHFMVNGRKFHDLASALQFAGIPKKPSQQEATPAALTRDELVAGVQALKAIQIACNQLHKAHSMPACITIECARSVHAALPAVWTAPNSTAVELQAGVTMRQYADVSYAYTMHIDVNGPDDVRVEYRKRPFDEENKW